MIGPQGERFVAGDPEKGKERSEWSLRAGREQLGTLILTGDEFGEDDGKAFIELLARDERPMPGLAAFLSRPSVLDQE